MKEVSYTLHGVNPPAEFRHYYEERNGQIAADIAALLGVPFSGEVTASGLRRGGYIVPVKTVDQEMADLFEIQGDHEFYGAKVSSMDKVGKAILHSTISEVTPEFYSPEFAEYVGPLVLPGATAFSREDAMTAYRQLIAQGHRVRMKMPNESDGNGQYDIVSEAELAQILTAKDADAIKEHGVVLETNVRYPRTVSVGYAKIGDQMYSFIANQKNDTVTEFDEAVGKDITRSRYAGAKVRVVKGDLEKLLGLEGLNVTEEQAIAVSIAFCEAYKGAMGVVASRLSFDYLRGFDARRNIVGGITDITARLGGTCPAIMVAAHEFAKSKHIYQIDSEVTLNYNPREVLEEEKGAKRYIDRESLRLSARVNTRYYH